MIYHHAITSKNDARWICLQYIDSGKKILDVGCACGDFGNAVKEKDDSAQVWGMEYDSKSIEVAKKTGVYKNIYQVDLNDFNDRDFKKFTHFFDYVIFSDVLEHLLQPQEVLDAFKIFLKKDGHFLLSIPNIAHASIKSNLLLNNFDYTPYGLLDQTHVKFFTHKTISHFLAELGLEIVENRFTYQDKIGSQNTDPYQEIPISIQDFIFKDLHSYVCQYVMKVQKTSISEKIVQEINQEKLCITKKNAPREILKLQNRDLKSFMVNSRHHEHLSIRELKNKLRFLFLHPKLFFRKYFLKGASKNKKYCSATNGAYKKHIRFLEKKSFEKSKDYVSISNSNYKHKKFDPKIIAFYLPQFHTIELNDKYYGAGFTEWTNVTKSIPQFTGHYQPHLPADLGFYNLLDTGVMKKQIALANKYGIQGFCFHYYWFSGRRLLEKPIINWLENKDLDFPFMLCWANENWAKLWDAGNKDVIMKQELKDDDDDKFMDDILPFFRDSRYIKIDNKPVLIIYRPQIFNQERALALFSRFREIAKEEGFPDLYLIMAKTHGFEGSPHDWGMDAVVEFPPHQIIEKTPQKKIEGYVNPHFKGQIFNMGAYIKNKKYLYNVDYTLFKTVFPGWDNTPRKAYSGAAVFDMNPDLYQRWLEGVLQYTKEHNSKNENLVFVNAWNEWAEGAHLEPDNKYGYAYLQATKNALERE